MGLLKAGPGGGSIKRDIQSERDFPAALEEANCHVVRGLGVGSCGKNEGPLGAEIASPI